MLYSKYERFYFFLLFLNDFLLKIPKTLFYLKTVNQLYRVWSYISFKQTEALHELNGQEYQIIKCI